MTNKLMSLFCLLSINIFGAEISIFEFLEGEREEVNDSNVYNFILVYSEKSLKEAHEESLENIFRFSYLLCIKLIDFMLANEDKLHFKNNELGFLKEDGPAIGTIKNYLVKSINQEMNTILSQKRLGAESISATNARVRHLCVLVNRVSNRLLGIVFDLRNGVKPENKVTIENLWEQYVNKCLPLKEKNSTNSQEVKKYRKLCKKNDALLLAINKLHGSFKNQQEIIDVTIKIIKSKQNILKFGS